MLSPDLFLDASEIADRSGVAEWSMRTFAEGHKLQAMLFVECKTDPHSSYRARWGYNVPLEPFNGSENGYIVEAVEQCFKIHPKPHVHSFSADSICLKICRFNHELLEQYRAWFYPIRNGADLFVFLGFPKPSEGSSLPVELGTQLSRLLVLLTACADAEELSQHILVTERFVKEVGHDVASAVQATVAKLRSIRDGRVTGDGLKHKAKEIELEIWDAYRIAESLGIAVDSNYEMRQQADFDVVAATDHVLNHFASEAAERHIRLRREGQNGTVVAWGEKAAIEQAIGQLISNAIKYSFGGTTVTATISPRSDDILIRVTNKGMPLPGPLEIKHIWDFGFRGQNAKERHVNGSGIGLYTVKKIVTAHHGWVDVSSGPDNTTEFFIHLPKKAALKKALGVLL